MKIRGALLAVLALVLPACGGGGSVLVVGVSPGALLLEMRGGSVRGVSSGVDDSHGGKGGALTMRSTGSIRFGSTVAPAKAAVPTPPASGFEVGSISADINDPRTLLISGAVTTDTGAATRTVTSTDGDIIVTGTLRAGDPGAGKPVDLSLTAMRGTVWILGTIDLENSDGTPNGDAAGSLAINALRIVFTGSVRARGEGSLAAGGAGGAITFSTFTGTEILLSNGVIDASGGDSTTTGSMMNGGNGGDISVTAGTELRILGTFLSSAGGNITTSSELCLGGHGGAIRLNGPGSVTFDAQAVATGGFCRGTGSAQGALGGNGGSFLVNYGTGFTCGPARVFGSIRLSGGDTFAASTNGGGGFFGHAGDSGSLEFSEGMFSTTGEIEFGKGDLALVGGDSPDTAGGGGNLDLMTTQGAILLECPIDLSAGQGGRGSRDAGDAILSTRQGDIVLTAPLTSRTAMHSGANAGRPGNGGDLTFACGTSFATHAGSIMIASPIDVSGASRTPAGMGSGSNAGTLMATANSVSGRVLLLSTASITANGGGSGGIGNGGNGGVVEFVTNDEAISIEGNITAVGGGSVVGSGGQGGRFVARSDVDNNDVSGRITIAAGVTINVSGGSGDGGGPARNNGGAAPTDATAAVVLASDGNLAGAGDDLGESLIQNSGTILAFGGTATGAISGIGGRGGDVMLSGAGPAGPLPIPGNVDVDGGTGLIGNGATGFVVPE